MVELQLPIGMLGTPAPTFQHFNDKKIHTKNKKSPNISLNKITTKTTSIMKPKSEIGIKSIFENQANSKKSSDPKAVVQPHFSTTEKMPALTTVTAMEDVVKGLKARPAPSLASVMAGLGGAKMPTLQSVVRDLKSGRRQPTFSALPAVPERAAVPAVPKLAAQPVLRQRPALPIVPDLSAVPAVPRRFDPVIFTFDYINGNVSGQTYKSYFRKRKKKSSFIISLT